MFMHAVIFDIDGTLLRSDASDDALFLASIRDVLGDVRLRPSWSDYTQFTASGILAEILADNAMPATTDTVPAVRDSFVARVLRHVADHGPFAEIPGARAFIDGLRRSPSHRIAYATGGWREAALLKLALANFPLEGIPLVTSNEHRERHEIMRLALQQLSGDFATVTYYGDGHWDAAAARALGWNFVAVGERLGGLLRYETDNA